MSPIYIKKRCILLKQYINQKVYFYSLIYITQVSNLLADYPFIKAWSLPSLSTIISNEVEFPFKYNHFFLCKDISFAIR